MPVGIALISELEWTDETRLFEIAFKKNSYRDEVMQL